MRVWLTRRLAFGAAVYAVSLVAGCSVPGEGQSDDLRPTSRTHAAAAGQKGKAPAREPIAEVFFCGGETTRPVVDRYFEDLEQALSDRGPDRLFDRFVRRKFSIRDAQGAVRRFDLATVEAITPEIISREEWQQISDSGPNQLQDAGWRGCFLGQGKFWFEASQEGGLGLNSINRTVPRDRQARN